MFERFGIK
jgi:hypothetical protein